MISSKINEPSNVKEALQSLNSDKWIIAMKDELTSMYTNKVWDLIDLSLGYKALGINGF